MKSYPVWPADRFVSVLIVRSVASCGLPAFNFACPLFLLRHGTGGWAAAPGAGVHLRQAAGSPLRRHGPEACPVSGGALAGQQRGAG